MTTATLHRAPVVVPVTRPPILDGAVAVVDGVIAAVGPFEDLLRVHPHVAVAEWTGALLPGLVNAHTHLQYTSFETVGAVSYPHYEAWSERFVVEYDSRPDEDWAAAARLGVEAGIRSGTTCFGDVVTDVGALGTLVEAGVSGVSYFELIGVDRWAWATGVEAQLGEVIEMAAETPTAHVGVSPHAPYSVDEPVLRASADLARMLGRRIHVHLAESDTEDAYYRTGTGALAERVTARVGRPWSILADGGAGVGAAEFAQACGLLGPDSHVAHGVYLGSEGRRLLREAGTYVALCPRSNATVGVDPPPVADFLAEDSPIAVGTDSLGSSPSLDLMADVALLRDLARQGGYRNDDLDRRLLRAATLGGAAALGLEHSVGSLDVGKRADLAIFEVEIDRSGIERAVSTEAAGACTVTIVAGGVR
ncbi:amidohydrolase family protein [soil metagenome]